ncbi:hypothetical protein AVEN_72596-1 [Araneus ventricosus]|uniref:Uncharacterized protein n=1 Tax=Araneus ventricosus TaxID=182803 RepID=A0A4Y2KP00_ARAVE|nr:hypothetical protein AVEN_72596-1 [Araneus ventricosus]
MLSIEQEQIISDLTVSRSTEQEQIVSDLTVSRSTEQEQIISSSNQLSPDEHSSKTTCPTPDEKVSEIDASENIPTNFCSESADQAISEKIARKVCNKMKVFKSLGQFRSKKSVSKTVKLRKKCNIIHSMNKPVSKKEVTLPPGTEESLTKTKNLHPGSSEQTCSSNPCIENFQITLRTSAEDRVSRVVSHASEVELAKTKNTRNVLNVPETVFQKIVLFLRSKVLLKCKDLQPVQQQEKANHLATLFIQNNVVGVLDKKTMKLLSEFADGYI